MGFGGRKEKMEKPRNSIELKNVENARHIGGYTLKNGRKIKSDILLRSAHLGNLSEEDKTRLLSVYNLKYIIDLRLPVEVAAQPDPVIDGVQNNSVFIRDRDSEKNPVMQRYEKSDAVNLDDPEQVPLYMLKMGAYSLAGYIKLIDSEDFKRANRKAFDVLLANKGQAGVLWHCRDGKDRTGLFAVFIMTLLGASFEDIVSEYLLTNEFNKAKISRATKKYSGQMKNDAELFMLPLAFGGVSRHYLDETFKFIDEKYGGVYKYCTDCFLVTEDEISRLMEYYTE